MCRTLVPPVNGANTRSPRVVNPSAGLICVSVEFSGSPRFAPGMPNCCDRFLPSPIGVIVLKT
jgi:hypothetical protein